MTLNPWLTPWECRDPGFSAAFKDVIGQSTGSHLSRLRMGHAEDALMRPHPGHHRSRRRLHQRVRVATAFRRTRTWGLYSLMSHRWPAGH